MTKDNERWKKLIEIIQWVESNDNKWPLPLCKHRNLVLSGIGCTFGALAGYLHKGKRGLPGGSTLSQEVAKCKAKWEREQKRNKR